MTHEDKLISPKSRAILALLRDHDYNVYIDPDPNTNRVVIVTHNVNPDGSEHPTYSCIPRDYISARLFVEGKLDATHYTKPA